MHYYKSLNTFAIIFCILMYVTCYGRFVGQAFLCLIQIMTAVFLTIEIYKKEAMAFKGKMKMYWLVTLCNLIILMSFFHVIMWNDFLQFTFVTLLPNIMAIYFYRLLTKYITYENA